MRLYLDENLSPRLAEALRSRGVDAISAHEAGLVGVDDRAQLRHAIEAGRMIVTADVADFVALARELTAANVSYPGMLLVPASFPAGDVVALAGAIEHVAAQYPSGAPDTVLVIGRRR